MLFSLSACEQRGQEKDSNNFTSSQSTKINEDSLMEETQMKTTQVKVIVGTQELKAEFYDNATTKALINEFPLTVPMMDLYSREMCYRFDRVLPTDETETSGYEVGDIAYWTPRHSFVIFYEQNNEVISNLQKIGRITSGVEIFKKTGDTEVTFDYLD